MTNAALLTFHPQSNRWPIVLAIVLCLAGFDSLAAQEPCYDASLYPKSAFHIHQQGDVNIVRRKLVHWIWKADELPTQTTSASLQADVEIPTSIMDTSTLENLKSIDRIHVAMPHEDGYAYNIFSSTNFLFVPVDPNQRLVIVHQGHAQNLMDHGVNEAIRALVKHGFTVLAIQMPLFGSNRVKDFPHHQWLGRHETQNFQPLKYFLGPINTTLNYIDQHYEFRDISMIGISGGGWTTHIYSAIDPRIKNSFPVAGSLPRYLRTEACSANNGHSEGDWEEGGGDIDLNGELCNTVRTFMEEHASFLDLYILGSTGPGRTQIHILNEFDSCCFSGRGFSSFESEVQNRVKKLGDGNYDVELDSSFRNDHRISEWAMVNVILSQLVGTESD